MSAVLLFEASTIDEMVFWVVVANPVAVLCGLLFSAKAYHRAIKRGREIGGGRTRLCPRYFCVRCRFCVSVY